MEKIKKELFKRKAEIKMFAGFWLLMALLGIFVDVLFLIIDPVGDPPIGSFAGMFTLIINGVSIFVLSILMAVQNFKSMVSFGVTRKQYIIGEIITSIVGTFVLLLATYGLLFFEGKIVGNIIGEGFKMDPDVYWILNHMVVIISVVVILAVFIRIAVSALILRLGNYDKWFFIGFYCLMMVLIRYEETVGALVSNIPNGHMIMLVGAGIIWVVGMILGVFSLRKQGIS